MSDPLKIDPIAPSFSQSPAKLPKRERSLKWPLLAIPLVLVSAYFLFQFLPETDLWEPQDQDSTSDTTDRVASNESITQTTTLPFQDIVLRRAEEQARNVLRSFGTLQDKVESEELGLADSRHEYESIIDAANSADTSFAKREFETAISQYEDATSRLQRYVDSKELQFEEAFEKGYTALTSRDLNTARDQLRLAEAIKPHDEALASAIQRLEKLPQVNELLREYRRAKLQGDLERAESLVLEAQSLDPETLGLGQKLLEVRQLDRTVTLNNVVSDAYAALENRELSEARGLFQRALQMDPDSQGAQTGLAATEQQLNLNEIGRLKDLGAKQESLGQLEAALETYKQALALDGNLKFARDGRLRTEATVRLHEALNRFINDPESLSSNKLFALAQTTLKEADAHFTDDQYGQQKANELRRLITFASKPLPLVLLSDNAMEIRLATVGELGPFVRKELTLRPGRYLLTGSANGCRDVRKTIVVAEDMVPISIRCNEPI